MNSEACSLITSPLFLCDPHRPERTLSWPIGYCSAVNHFPSDGPGFHIIPRSRSSPHRSSPIPHRSSPIPNRTTALLTNSFPSPLGELRSPPSESAVCSICPGDKYNLFCSSRTIVMLRVDATDPVTSIGAVRSLRRSSRGCAPEAVRRCKRDALDAGVGRVRPTRLAEAEPEQELAEIPEGDVDLLVV